MIRVKPGKVKLTQTKIYYKTKNLLQIEDSNKNVGCKTRKDAKGVIVHDDGSLLALLNQQNTQISDIDNRMDTRECRSPPSIIISILDRFIGNTVRRGQLYNNETPILSCRANRSQNLRCVLRMQQ